VCALHGGNGVVVIEDERLVWGRRDADFGA
jgi:hypothetical protein